MCRRGEIYHVDFGEGRETHKQSGMRPAVVVSNNKANASSPVVTVVPLTGQTWKKRYLPTHVQIPLGAGSGLTRPSMALAEQVETVDKRMLEEKMGEIQDELIMERITIALQIQIGAYAEYN